MLNWDCSPQASMAVVLNLDCGSVAAELARLQTAAWEAATPPCEARDLSRWETVSHLTA